MWQLELEEEIIATFSDVWTEFPWYHGKIVNSPKFELYRDFFSDDKLWDLQEFEDLFYKISSKGDFILRDISTNAIYDNAMLYEDGNFVSFRCCQR